MSKACRIEARSKRQRTGPVVFRGCYKLHRQTEPLQFNHGHPLTFPRTATLVEARADKPISIFGTYIDRLPISSARSAFHSPASHSRRCSNR